MSLRKAVASGDKRAALEAIRDKLAGDLEVCEPAQSAAIAKQLQAVLAELEPLLAAKQGSKVDDLARARKSRRATPKDPPPAVGDLLHGG